MRRQMLLYRRMRISVDPDLQKRLREPNSRMKVLIVLLIVQMVVNESIQKPSATDKKPKKTAQELLKLQEMLQNKLSNARSGLDINSSIAKSLNDLKNSSRKPKSLPFFPFFPPPPIPFSIPPGFFLPNNKDLPDNPSEWLSRTEPFKKNPLIDSPTYYIRLPPNPYIFVPGLGYVSRPPALSDPDLLDPDKTHHNDVASDLHDSFYKIPINFVSNGKPTSVYQLPSPQALPKPESALLNLSKGPYVFNGKPNEIYLVAQIYDALYGDELSHFYP